MSSNNELKAAFLALGEDDFLTLSTVAGVDRAIIDISDLGAARQIAWISIADDSKALAAVENLLGGGRFNSARVAELALEKVQEQGAASPLPPARPAPSMLTRAPPAAVRPPEKPETDSGVDLRRVYGISVREGSMRI